MRSKRSSVVPFTSKKVTFGKTSIMRNSQKKRPNTFRKPRRREYFSSLNKRGIPRWGGCPLFGHGKRFIRPKQKYSVNFYYPLVGTIAFDSGTPSDVIMENLNKKNRKRKKRPKKGGKFDGERKKGTKKILKKRFYLYNNKVPGPGSYKVKTVFDRISTAPKHYRAFNRSSSRLPKIRKTGIPGPGKYYNTSQVKEKIRTKMIQKERILLSRSMALKKRSGSAALGVGNFPRMSTGSVNFNKMKKNYDFKSYPMYSTGRRFSDIKVSKVPGPGSYDLEGIDGFVTRPFSTSGGDQDK